MMRVRKIGDFIDRLNVVRVFKATLNIVKIIVYLILFLHNFACFWARVTKYHGELKYIFDLSGKFDYQFTNIIDEASGFSENTWFPPYSYLNVNDLTLYDTNEFKRYSVMFYSATVMLGLGDTGPVNNNEKMF